MGYGDRGKWEALQRQGGEGWCQVLAGARRDCRKCEAACLEDRECKFMTMKTKGKSSKWQCISFKSCKKLKKKSNHDVYKKSKGESTDDALVRSLDEDVSESERTGKKDKK